MTRARTVEAGFWLVAAAAANWAALTWDRSIPLASAIPAEVPVPPAAPVLVSRAALSAAAAATVEKNPFRLARRPADVHYGSELEGAPQLHFTEPEAVPRNPALAVAGILGGPPWEALIEGVPGHEDGVVVRVGEVIGELRIRAIGRDLVVVEGADTTWRLTLKRPWQ